MNLQQIKSITKREVHGYFSTPLAYVFIVIFLFLSGVFTFYVGGFYERGQADLIPFFRFHPWLFLFLIPAITMRLWAEERKTGMIELLITFPITTTELVIGKFLAAWIFTSIAILLTFPIWITVNLLGSPDNTVVMATYIGSIIMAAAYIAVGSCISSITKSQVIAFVLSLFVCFLLMISGFAPVVDIFRGWLPQVFIEAIASFSFLTHFNAMSKGIIDFRDVFYFSALTTLAIYINVVIIETKKNF